MISVDHESGSHLTAKQDMLQTKISIIARKEQLGVIEEETEVSITKKQKSPMTTKKSTKTVEGKHIARVRDELEYATNWRRAFNRIFTHLKWLNSYAKINYIAAVKQLDKAMRTYFYLPDNILDKKIHTLLDAKEFAHRKQVN